MNIDYNRLNPVDKKRHYDKVHQYIKRNYEKSGVCFYCLTKTKTEWSNIDHQYRLIKEEWQEVCKRCHEQYDKVMNNKKHGRKRMNKYKYRISVTKKSILKDAIGMKWGNKNDLLNRLKSYQWFA